MALTRLRTNQYSDAFSPTTAASLDANGNVIAGSANIGSGITGQKLEYYTITGDKWAPNITAYSNLTIAGTLTVLGDVTSVEAQQTRVTDSIIGLAYGADTASNTVTHTLYTYTSSGDDTVPDGEVVGTTLDVNQSSGGQFNGVNVSVTTSTVTTTYNNDLDIGFIGMKDPLNFAAVYSASQDQFVLGWTADNELVDNISFSSYANIRANIATFDGLSLGNIVIANNTITTDGNSSIYITPNGADADSNVYLYAGNIVSNTLITTSGNVSGGNLTTAGAVDATGNVSGGNITTIGVVEATGNVSGDNLVATNDVSGATLTISGNVTGGNLVTAGVVEATGNVIGGNITTIGVVDATGNVSGANLVTTGNVDAVNGNFSEDIYANNATITGTFSAAELTATGNVNGNNIVSTNDVTTATVTASGNATVGNLITSGTVEATGNVSGGNITTVGVVEATGNVSGDNLVATNDVSGATLTISGNVTGGNLVTAGVVDATGNVSGGNFTTAGVVEATGNVIGGNLVTTGDASVTGNVDAGNVNVSTGTVTANSGVFNYLTIDNDLRVAGNLNVDGNLTYLSVETLRTEDTIIDLNTAANGVVDSGIITGTDSGIRSYYADDTSAFFGRLDSAGEFVYYSSVSAAANATTITGTIGNIHGGNLIADGDVSGATLTISGNVSGGNLTTAGVVDATGNVIGGNITTVGVVEATGNVSGGNLTTTGDVEATGNVIGGNLVTTGNVDISGNINGVGAIFSGNVTADKFIGNLDAGGANTYVQFNDDDAINGVSDFTFDKDTLVLTVTGNIVGGNLTTAGDVDATGNLNGGNLIVTGDVSGDTLTITSNITGGNLISLGTVEATGNVSGANITTVGVVEATGNVSGDNLIAVGDVSGATLTISGNVSGGNLTTAGVVEATGNVIGGNITTVGVVEATGNVIGGNLVTTGVTSTVGIEATGTSNLGNITISGDTISNKESSNDVQINPAASGNVVINSGLDPDYQFKVQGGDENLFVASDNQVAIWSNAYVDGDGSTIAFTFTPNITLDIQSNLSMRIPTGNTSQRPGNPTQGMLRFNTADAVIEWYDGSTWEQARTGGQAVELYSFTGNGAVDFDIANGSADTSILFVAINGVIQQPGVGNSYTVVSNSTAGTSTITFDEAPTAQDTIDVRVIGVVDTLNGFSYGNASIVVSGENWSVTGDLNPSANVTYNLGSDSLRWANLHLAGNTIYLGGGRIEYDGSTFAFKDSGGSSSPLPVESGGTGANTSTGTGSVVLSASPTFTGTLSAATINAATIGNSGAVLTINSITKAGNNGTGNIGQTDNRFNTVFAQATSALYADLAENYKGDKSYAPGTVVMFGGDAEVTQCNEESCRKVAGVVSTAPAYLMNDNGEENMVAVALMGRVPTQVRGPVRKGDMMVSAGDGKAMASDNPAIGSVIGKSLENFDGEIGIVEVVIGKL